MLSNKESKTNDAHRKLNKTTPSNHVIDTGLDFISLQEAAEIFKVAKVSMYRLVEKRILPFYKPFGKILFKKQDLMQFTEERRTEKIATY
jgi:excisionase family DNA binding protein